MKYRTLSIENEYVIVAYHIRTHLPTALNEQAMYSPHKLETVFDVRITIKNYKYVELIIALLKVYGRGH